MNDTKRFGRIALALVLCCAAALLFARAVPARAREAFGPGDLDGDGVVTAGDARLALRCAVGLEDFAANDPTFLAGDLNGSKTITAADARLILRSAVDLEDPSAPSQPLSEIYSYAPDASDTAPASFRLEPDEVQDGKLTVKLYLCGAVGLKSADYTLTYDPAVLRFKREDLGQDAQQIKNTKSNSFTAEVNGNAAPGVTNAAFYFKTELTDAAAFAADSKYDDRPVSINAERFHCLTFTFELLDPEVKEADVTLNVKETGGLRVSSAANIRLSYVKTVDSGVCGDDLTWTLTSDGLLTISGQGDMWDWDGPQPWNDWQSDVPWEAYHDAIKEIVINDGVTSIGSASFGYCPNLTSVSIPDGVTRIGVLAFGGCESLTAVTIPDGVTSIGFLAFASCKNLTDISIPESVEEIGNDAFSETAWFDLQPDGLIYIGKIAYKYKGIMPENTTLNIKDGTLSISSDAFRACKNLIAVTIPNSVTSIGDCVFSDCTSLTAVTIPESVTNIGDTAFSGCRSLTAVTIPEGVTYIGDYTFFDCRSLPAVKIPDGVTGIGEFAFNCCTSLTSVTIPDGVTRIGNNAFACCESLTAVTIPDSVTDVGEFAFSGCGSLRLAVIGENVKKIEGNVFSACDFFPDYGLFYCGSEAKWNAIAPDVDMKPACFDCRIRGRFVLDSLETTLLAVLDPASQTGEIILPDGLRAIGNWACSGCAGVSAVRLPDSVISIGSHAFEGCANLKFFTVPDSVISIGSHAFEGCANLKFFTVPDRVEKIGFNAFSGCDSLTGFAVSANNAYFSAVNGVLFNLSKTVLVKYPNAMNAGAGYTVPDSVTIIGECAFDGSALSAVTIPGNVIMIKIAAFRNCANLTDVYFDGTEEKWGSVQISEYENDPLLHATIHYHQHTPGQPNEYGILAPTCGEPGEKKVTVFCTVCGELISETIESIPATGKHTFGDWSITEAPSCTEKGTEMRTCSVCLTKETREVSTIAHNFSGWTVTKEPTVDAEGVETRSCFVCGTTEIRAVPKLDAPDVPVIDTATMREANGALYAVAEQKAADLLAVAGEGATLTAADGTPAVPDAVLASGMVLTKADGTQETVIVKGDNDGDGRITASDARQALRAAVGLDTPNAWQQDASLVAGGETITAADARLILRAAVGLEESKSWLAA